MGDVKSTKRELAIRRESDYELGGQSDLFEARLLDLGFSLPEPISIGLECTELDAGLRQYSAAVMSEDSNVET